MIMGGPQRCMSTWFYLARVNIEGDLNLNSGLFFGLQPKSDDGQRLAHSANLGIAAVQTVSHKIG